MTRKRSAFSRALREMGAQDMGGARYAMADSECPACTLPIHGPANGTPDRIVMHHGLFRHARCVPGGDE